MSFADQKMSFISNLRFPDLRENFISKRFKLPLKVTVDFAWQFDVPLAEQILID